MNSQMSLNQQNSQTPISLTTAGTSTTSLASTLHPTTPPTPVPPSPITNSSTGAGPTSQARRDERAMQSVVQALKETIRRMRTTLASVPTPDAGVQDFLRINLDMADLIEMWSNGHDFEEIYTLIQEVNDQYSAMIRRDPTAEGLRRRIASIASSTNELVPALSNLLTARSTKQSSIAGDSDRLIVVARFLRRVREEPSPNIPHRVSLPPLTPLDIQIPF
ncbi:hypothetical protein EDD18DRAFT_1185799 [Armillaria luteobubalina]|uniref:Uncharacterized protein n=1 Tax=Armillaria luteobubalina TaxID=153913 RepID=A0AA39PWS2_9AGAR|nr:hypothetical protein EDD18DRAFT_1185799 [Armillaria luteobubalina]